MKLFDVLLDGTLVLALLVVGSIQVVGLVRTLHPDPPVSAACSIPTTVLPLGK
jgi:hypothetical protein